MPIPPHKASGILPPFVGGPDPTKAPGVAAMAPFVASIDEVAARFTATSARKTIFDGFLRHRAALRALGLLDAFQWLDGSFVDLLPTEPHDVDAVTFLRRPASVSTESEFQTLVANNLDVFDRTRSKAKYHVDAFFVDLAGPGETVVRMTRYWYGLFSHRRVTLEWRGMVQVPLASSDDDAGARRIISEGCVS